MVSEKFEVREENDFSYTNKFNKKSLRFSPKVDEVMATFKSEVNEAAARDVLAGTAGTTGMNLNRGFAVFNVAHGQDLQSASRTLKSRSEIANTIPVMIDNEGLTRYFLPDEFTVQFRDGVSQQQAEQIVNEKGSAIVAVQRTPGYYTLAVPKGKGLFETIREFSALNEVAFAEPSEAGFNDALDYIPDDTHFASLWGLHNTGQTVNGVPGTVNADINAPAAWNITRGDPNIIIAVIDTGADLNHPDLTANFLPQAGEDWDFADAGDSSPDDADGHGTHVAGTAAGVDNTGGVIGVAPRCRIMPLRVNLTAGMNQNRADAISYVATQAANHPERRYVINCSWKMNGDHAGVHNAIINAVNNNVVVVYAAGNANADIDVTPQYPAVYPEVIAVAATDQSDIRATFSNYGTKVDVAAPGVNIYSSVPDDAYAFSDGTSMASPHVAGLAGLIWSRNGTLTNQQVRQVVENNCDNIDAKNPGFAGKLGKGRINAYRSLLNTPPPPIASKLLRQFAFPQKNQGSSSALSFVKRIRVGARMRMALLFLTQQPFSERIYYLNPVDGAVLGSVDPVDNDTIGSLEWDGANIRVANVTTGSGFINTIHPITGAQLGTMSVPAGRGEGLAHDGAYFYYSTITRIHVIKASTGAVVRSFVPPGGDCRALAYGAGWLFSGNSASGIITVFHPTTLLVRGTIAAPGTGSEKCEGLAFNVGSRELFIANQSENKIYVCRISL